jgi:hypothetical protein
MSNFYYYQCEKCNYISKQKIDMKRHLEKQKKCIIINNINDKNEGQLYNDSLIKKKMNEEFNVVLKKKNDINPKFNKCNKCNKMFNNKSNLNKHMKHNVCNSENIDIDQKEVNQITNIQNIGIQNNIINININSLRGFDEDWNISNITKDMREKILLSDKKFTNTLENILKNDENLNIILKDKATGFVYKTKNNDYEVMHVKDILEESMDKIYKHLRYFFSEIVDNNKNDIRIDILENELKEVDKKYQTYKNSIMINNTVNNCLSNIFDDKKIEALEQFIKIKNNIDYDNIIDNGY